MGWRFRKSFTLMPGVRVGFGLHGPSVSIGGKGFRTTFGSNGRVTRSIGIPGTGLSYVTTVGGGSRRSSGGGADPGRPTRPGREAARMEDRTEQTTSVQRPAQPSPQPPAPDHQTLYDTAYDQIRAIYRSADREINWRQILISGPVTDADDERTAYCKPLAQDVINGDIETYFKLISDLNPLDDLMEYGSGFECGTDDPRMIGVHFMVNSRRVLDAVRALPQERYNSLLQDYVCGCAIRVARDMFALLPVRHILVEASDGNNRILSVDFTRTGFSALNFDAIDPSDTVQSFEHRMQYSASGGFLPVEALDP